MKIGNLIKRAGRTLLTGAVAEPVDTSIPRAQRRRVKRAIAKGVSQNLGVEERDGMPVEVAEAMLFTPGTKLTGAMRKNCMAARETVYRSTLEGKTFEQRCAEKAKKASAEQLLKWARRTVEHRAEVTRDYLNLSIKKSKLDPMKLHEHAKANRVLAIMDIKAQQLDAQMASYRAEAENRLLSGVSFQPVR